MQLQAMEWWSRSAQQFHLTTGWLKPLIIGLLTFNLIASSPVQSVEQLTLAQCEQLDQALESNRDEQRAGYALRDSERIKDEELQLEKQLRTYCESPVSAETTFLPLPKASRRSAKTSLAKTDAKQHPKLTKSQNKASKINKDQGKVASGSEQAGLRGALSPQAQHRHFLASLVELRTPYAGAQQQAWLAWYQEPYWCYGVKMTAKIVACVNKRQHAQEQFEKWWQSQNLSDQ